MKTIKFRAWDKEKKTMYIPDIEDIFVCDGVVYISAEIKYNTPNTEIVRLPNAIPLQYTGLKDVNGKEIYEGDIVRLHWEYPEEKPVVIKTIFDIYHHELDSDKCEIIGNIYENPELLEGE